MFTIIASSTGCQVCEKDKPSLHVRCDKGTIDGPVCHGCISKLVHAREKARKPEAKDRIPELIDGNG